MDSPGFGPNSSIYVAGHNGLVGSAILRTLEARGVRRPLTRSRSELDLTNQAAVLDFFAREKPQYVFLAAAKVGGIYANNAYPADFIRENLLIQSNVIEGAFRAGARRLMFLGSSCIYPRLCPQPIKEEYILTGPLEPTNEPYAVAKIAGVKMCEALNRQHGTKYISVMPTNLYGPNDNFDLKNSHVLPALIRKFHEAKAAGLKEVELWGTGTSRREFLYVDDMADACAHLMAMEDYTEMTNIGVGMDVTIRELAGLIQKVVGFEGRIRLDPSKPDGTPQKLLDVSKLKKLGWEPKVSLEEGIRKTYRWFCANLA